MLRIGLMLDSYVTSAWVGRLVAVTGPARAVAIALVAGGRREVAIRWPTGPAIAWAAYWIVDLGVRAGRGAPAGARAQIAVGGSGPRAR